MRIIRERIKQIPVLGPLLYSTYLKAFFDEGKVETIAGGPLKGKSWIRFMRTTLPGYLTGQYEVSVQQALATHLKPGMVFYDIGANAGFFSLLGSSLVGASGKVVAFEPHPISAHQLNEQMRANKVSNVDVVIKAMSDNSGTSLFADDLSADMLSLVEAGQSRRTIAVSTTTIDNEVQSRGAPNVLKIDVEGAEISVLRGGMAFIKASKPILLVEVHSPEIAIQYDEFMHELGYRTWDLDGNPISVAKSGTRFVVSMSH